MSYKDLTVWQKSMSLTTTVYEVTNRFPKEETYGIVSQMRRCAVSIPSNIAEGSRRRGNDTKQFLRIAYGSGAESETQIEISRRLEFLSETSSKQLSECLTEVMKMLNVMISK